MEIVIPGKVAFSRGFEPNVQSNNEVQGMRRLLVSQTHVMGDRLIPLGTFPDLLFPDLISIL
jgi:hypothetical protein